MTAKTKKLIITLSIITSILLAGFIIVNTLLEAPEYPTPSGKYSVGTHVFTATDFNRKETLSKNYTGDRRLAVRAFYPALEEQNKNFLNVDDPRIMNALSNLYGIPAIADETVLSNSRIDAKAVEGGRFPVIVFSHGGMSYNTQNLTTFEELASRGYVVLAVSHTYEAVATIMADGEVIYTDQELVSKATETKTTEEYNEVIEGLKKRKTNISNEEKVKLHKESSKIYKDLRPLIKTRIDDMRFISRFIKHQQNIDNLPFKSIMDTEKLGAFGHSLGGLTVQYACSEINTLYQAGISMDMDAYIFDERNHTLQTPFAYYYSSEMTFGDAGSVDLTGTNTYFEDTSNYEVYSLRFEGTKHNNFLDANLVPPLLKIIPALQLGSIDGLKMLNMLNNSIADYFDYTLKGYNKNIYTTLTPYSEELEIKKVN